MTITEYSQNTFLDKNLNYYKFTHVYYVISVKYLWTVLNYKLWTIQNVVYKSDHLHQLKDLIKTFLYNRTG